MLSVLIPTYNYNVFPLVQELHKQANNLKIAFEIIVADDGSNASTTNTQNEQINTLANCKFITYKKNEGLSNNRNKLAKLAKYGYYLFIDGDSILPSKNFIKNYVACISTNTAVIYGGRIHPKKKLKGSELRWKYGKLVEDKTAAERKKHAYKRLLFNNTLIEKHLFNEITFNKSITEYGHEDTLFAYQLSLLKTPVLHIDNPVIHNDIDTSNIFLQKTKKSLENLYSLHKQKLIQPQFVTLLSYYTTLKKYHLTFLFSFLYKLFHKLFVKQLMSSTPSIKLFGLYKLSYFCFLNTK